jgi:hypothetical protein
MNIRPPICLVARQNRRSGHFRGGKRSSRRSLKSRKSWMLAGQPAFHAIQHTRTVAGTRGSGGNGDAPRSRHRSIFGVRYGLQSLPDHVGRNGWRRWQGSGSSCGIGSSFRSRPVFHALQTVSTDTVPMRARAGVGSSKTGCVLLLFYFRLFSGRPSLPNEKREKRSIYL